MVPLPDLLLQAFQKVLVTLSHNWPFLLVSVLISAGLKLYMNPDKVGAFITRYRRAGVLGATAAAVVTPFCSCGTTAVMLGMIASTIPWAPIVAFMVASPLTSPEEMIYSAGLFGWPFAIAFFASSILLGLLGGFVADLAESRGWLANQARFNLQPAPACACATAPQPLGQAAFAGAGQASAPVMAAAAVPCCGVIAIEEPPASCDCGGGQTGANAAQAPAQQPSKVTARQWVTETWQTGRQLLAMFLGFAFIGYLLNGLIPAAWISTIFGSGNAYSVPLAAILGLPLYINTEGSLPLVRALIDGGMSQGAALAFLITGAGTSVGAIAGALTIARWRVIALVIGTLIVGAMIAGYLYNLYLLAL